MIEITKTKYWCSSCDAKENNYMITIRLGDNNGSSFILCKDDLSNLALQIKQLE